MLASNHAELWREVVEQRLAARRFDSDVARQLRLARRAKPHWLSRQIRRQVARLGRTLVTVGRRLQKFTWQQQPFPRS